MVVEGYENGAIFVLSANGLLISGDQYIGVDDSSHLVRSTTIPGNPNTWSVVDGVLYLEDVEGFCQQDDGGVTIVQSGAVCPQRVILIQRCKYLKPSSR